VYFLCLTLQDTKLVWVYKFIYEVFTKFVFTRVTINNAHTFAWTFKM